mmetsp:Transcript_10022/g.30621  ORF Transcript_10022/g.30621 Transcript_10022/m.30621 type:complete len:81 (+) Transcript_10022:299-541(+)
MMQKPDPQTQTMQKLKPSLTSKMKEIASEEVLRVAEGMRRPPTRKSAKGWGTSARAATRSRFLLQDNNATDTCAACCRFP